MYSGINFIRNSQNNNNINNNIKKKKSPSQMSDIFLTNNILSRLFEPFLPSFL